MSSRTAAELAAARHELAQLHLALHSRDSTGQHRTLTEAGKKWAETASHDMARRVQAQAQGGSASRLMSLAAELESARRELLALSSIVTPDTPLFHAASSSDWQSAGQISVAAVTSAQRASFTPVRAREYRTSAEVHRRADRASALAEARDELARLQGLLAAAEHPRPSHRPQESLAQLRAEREYLEGLDRGPTSYKLPPGDAELAVQILRFYDYTSAALEPQILDYYAAGGREWKTRVPTPLSSPKVQRQASELSVLRQQLAEIQQQQQQQEVLDRSRFNHHQQFSMVSPSTPGMLGLSTTGFDYISFGDGSSALMTPSPFGSSFEHSATTARSLQLQRELAAARAELDVLRQ